MCAAGTTATLQASLPRSRRVYKEPYSHERSVGIIVEGKGKHFDPVLVALFECNQAAFGDIYRDAQAT